MSKKDSKEEKTLQQENKDLFKVEITVAESGNISLNVNAEDNKNLPGTFELIGLIETVKADLINSTAQEQAPQPKMDMVEITLSEFDFNTPNSAWLKEQGYKIGDVVKMPREIAELRQQGIEKTNADTKVVPMTGVAESGKPKTQA